MIRSVDHDILRWRFPESLGRSKSAKSSTDNHDLRDGLIHIFALAV
jgi:hypothetical protein